MWSVRVTDVRGKQTLRFTHPDRTRCEQLADRLFDEVLTAGEAVEVVPTYAALEESDTLQ